MPDVLICQMVTKEALADLEEKTLTRYRDNFSCYRLDPNQQKRIEHAFRAGFVTAAGNLCDAFNINIIAEAEIEEAETQAQKTANEFWQNKQREREEWQDEHKN